MKYSKKFKEKAIKRFITEDGMQTKQEIAKELKVSQATLYKWVKESKEVSTGNTLSKQAQLQILNETYNMDEEALSAYCREKGIFVHQIQTFQDNLLSTKPIRNSSFAKRELEEEKAKTKALKKELLRKEKALAEAAALLVLQKKFQALFQDEA